MLYSTRDMGSITDLIDTLMVFVIAEGWCCVLL